MDPFVTWDWCESNRAEIVIVDARWYWDRPGVDAYRGGHIPGAVFVDLDADLTGGIGERTGRQPFPEPEDFARAMSTAGIDGRRPVVAYDDAAGVIAARLVWMLRLLDVPAAVLSGGLNAYSGELATEAPRRAPTFFAPHPWPTGALWSTSDVATRTSGTLIDARPANRYRGEEPEVDRALGKVPEADPAEDTSPARSMSHAETTCEATEPSPRRNICARASAQPGSRTLQTSSATAAQALPRATTC